MCLFVLLVMCLCICLLMVHYNRYVVLTIVFWPLLCRSKQVPIPPTVVFSPPQMSFKVSMSQQLFHLFPSLFLGTSYRKGHPLLIFLLSSSYLTTGSTSWYPVLPTVLRNLSSVCGSGTYPLTLRVKDPKREVPSVGVINRCLWFQTPRLKRGVRK